jgi:hypothetical protein
VRRQKGGEVLGQRVGEVVDGGLIVLGLHQEVAAACDDLLHRSRLAVERIGGD